MGIRTKEYEEQGRLAGGGVTRSQVTEQNQPLPNDAVVLPVEGAANNLNNGNDNGSTNSQAAVLEVGVAVAKPQGKKTKAKASKGRKKGAKGKKVEEKAVPPPVPVVPLPLVVPPLIISLPPKKTPAAASKKGGKKRKQGGKGKEEKVEKVKGKGVATTNDEIPAAKKEAQVKRVPEPEPVPIVVAPLPSKAKPKPKARSSKKKRGKWVPTPPPPISTAKQMEEKVEEKQKEEEEVVVEQGVAAGLKNGIVKANQKMKKGMRIMLGRTNKILGLGRKKPPRTKSPVKPRILPARASARLCVRKNSGEHEQGLRRSDQPLRTVELIRRPLELRDPATKLLYLASLSLYPKADPESDTTPIVIISEEIPNPGGKRPKIRSLELPLLPNWRNVVTFHSPSRALVDDPLLLSLTSIGSPSITEKQENFTTENVRRKTPEKKVQTEIETCNSTKTVSELKPKAKPSRNKKAKPLDSEFANGQIQDEKQAEVEVNTEKKICDFVNIQQQTDKTKVVPVVKEQETKNNSLKISSIPNIPQIQNNSQDEELSNTIRNYSLVSGLTISPSKPPSSQAQSPLVVEVNIQPKPALILGGKELEALAKREISSKPIPAAEFTHREPFSFHFRKFNPVVNNFIIQEDPEAKSADKLETRPIAKAAPVKRKRKSLETIIKEIPNVKKHKLGQMPTNTTEYFPSLLSTSNEPISRNPILEGLMKTPARKRKPKLCKKLEGAQTSQVQTIPMSLINVQNPISMTIPLQQAPVKEAVTKPRIKKSGAQQSQFQLPMPLPIPLPPGILSFASLAPSNNLPKVKRQRKPKAPKPTAILDVPSLPQVQPHLSDRERSIHNNNQVPSIPFLPSHLEAFFHSVPSSNGNISTSNACSSSQMYLDSEQSEQALDLCVKVQTPIVQSKKSKKPKVPVSTKSLLKPMNVEEDIPLNLVMSRGGIQVASKMKKHDTIDGLNLDIIHPPVKAQGNLENVKQMLARLHTKIAPAVNGVQLITIE